jgi:AbrB family looped-hinge helix DNA binding protein
MEAIITMDKTGRIVLPKGVRKRFKTSRFELRVTGDKIELTPVKSLESLFGKLSELDIERIRREHEYEVENEHF